MKKFYLLATIFYLILFTAKAYNTRSILLSLNHSLVDTNKNNARTVSKITDTRKDKPAFLKTGISVNVAPFKPGSKSIANSPVSASTAKSSNPDKVVNNVKIYPNPVEDQLNLSYYVTKDSNVTIKIMDILGNEITTLLSQRLPAGEQVNSFSIASKLSSGYYFIRLVVGNETVVKRISIL